MNSSKQASPFLLILDDSFFQRTLPMNQWVNIPISNIDQYTDTYSFPPLVQGHHRTFGGRADTPCEAGGQCWYQSGLPVSHAGFPKKVTTKLHRGTRASNSTAFPWRNVYIFIKVRIPYVHNSLVGVILPYLLIFTCFAKRGIPYKELLL